LTRDKILKSKDKKLSLDFLKTDGYRIVCARNPDSYSEEELEEQERIQKWAREGIEEKRKLRLKLRYGCTDIG